MQANSEQRKRELVRPIPGNWWLRRRPYTVFMLRELSAGFIALYAILLFRLMHRAPDQVNFGLLVDELKGPTFIFLHLVVLGFALLNTITTFNLAPRVFKLYRGEEKVPESLIAGAHYAAWIVASIVLLVIAWRA